MKVPCYNTETKTDCPRRHAGCSADCPKWNKYLKERDEDYKQRAIEYNANAAMFANANRIRNSRQRRSITIRQNKTRSRD